MVWCINRRAISAPFVLNESTNTLDPITSSGMCRGTTSEPRPEVANAVSRHVRVNHTDRDMNDPRLRDVLAQRSEGGTRGRRRRFGG